MLARFEKKKDTNPRGTLKFATAINPKYTLSKGPAPTPTTITKNRGKKVKFSFRLAQTHNQSVLEKI